MPLSLLLVTPWSPERNVGGAILRWRELARAFSAMGEVVLFAAEEHCPHDPFVHDVAELRDGDRVFPDPHSVHYCPAVQRALEDLVARGRFDVVVFSELDVASYQVRMSPPPPVSVLDLHNAQSVLEADVAEALGEDAPSWMDAEYLAGITGLQRLAVRASAAVWLCSEVDRATMARLYPEAADRMSVLPNTVDVPPHLPVAGGPTRATFIGRFDWFPNQEALRFVGRELMPVLTGAAASLDVIAAGYDPPADLVAESEKNGVRVIRNPEDVSAIREDSVTLVPIFTGSGTRFKILEAMATGSPVISTAKGIEGIEAEPDVHYLRAENAHDFDRMMNLLLADRMRREEMTSRAHKLVLRKYSRRALVKAAEKALAPLHRLPQENTQRT